MFGFLGAEGLSETDPETGLPMLLRTVLPVGFLGIMMAAYFSAILSTADSCLMASSGNIVSDIIAKFVFIDENSTVFIRFSQAVTLLVGAFALLLASAMTNVLDLMLDSYAFMVSGLFCTGYRSIILEKKHTCGCTHCDDCWRISNNNLKICRHRIALFTRSQCIWNEPFCNILYYGKPCFF
jgi:solute:Na+ symporter, SSS family